MAVTAKFQADFASFYDAVQRAELQLDKLTGGADKAGAALTRMVKDFSGQKLIQEATLATKAVEDIGGATALTQKEQARVNALLNEAIAKYSALGKEAPADMVALANATKQVETATAAVKAPATDILGTITKIGSAVGLGFSAASIISFGKSVFDTASQIHDMGERLGISAEAVQGFKFAAEQAGSSLDTVGIAISKMNDHLADGDKSTIAALKSAGLSFAEIRSLSPEDAFLAITDAIQKIPDPMIQTNVAMQLFGKSAAELLPAIKEGFRQTADSAAKMSDETVKELEAAQDAWDKFGNTVTIWTGKLIARTLEYIEIDKTLQREIEKHTAIKPPSIDLGNIFGSTGPRQIVADVDKVEAELNKVRVALDQAAEAHAKLIQNTRNDIFGVSTVNEAKAYAEALGNVSNLSRVTAEEQKKLHDVTGAALDVFKARGQEAPAALREIYRATIQVTDTIPLINRWRDSLAHSADGLLTITPIASKLANETWPRTIDGLERMIIVGGKTSKQTKDITADLGDMSRALSELAQISGGTFSGMASSLATLVSAANSAKKAIDLMRDAGKQTSKFEGLLDMATGITGIVSAAIAAGKAVASLFGLFDRNKGRDVVVDFAQTFGGFDKLHEQLLTLGDAGEALWIKLTQGVGRNNPEQARKVIEEIEEALRKQKDASEEAGSSTEEQAQATIETATEAQKALEELAPKIKDNEDLWKEWGATVTGQIDAIAKGLRSLNLPNPSGELNGGTASGGSGLTVNSTLVLDGRVAAESVAATVLGG